MVRKPGWHGRVPSPPRSRRASCSSWTHRRGRSRRSTRSLPNTAPHTRSTRLGPTASVSPSLSTGTPPSLRSTSAPPPSPAAAAGASSVVEKVVAASRSPLVPTLRPTSTLGRRPIQSVGTRSLRWVLLRGMLVNPSHSMRSTLRPGNPPRSPTCRTSFPEPKSAPWRVLLETSTKVDPRYDGTDWKGDVACTCIDRFLSTRNDMYSAPVRVQERFTIHIYNNMGLRQTAPPPSRVYAPVNG